MRLAHKSLSELEWKSLFLISTERNDATQHVIEGMTRGSIYKKWQQTNHSSLSMPLSISPKTKICMLFLFFPTSRFRIWTIRKGSFPLWILILVKFHSSELLHAGNMWKPHYILFKLPAGISPLNVLGNVVNYGYFLFEKYYFYF